MLNFILGMYIGILAFIAFVENTDSITRRANDAITECQKHLPRDEHCRVVALPVSKD